MVARLCQQQNIDAQNINEKSHVCFFQGAFTFRGQMIDMPTYLQAKNIERLSQATQTLQNSE